MKLNLDGTVVNNLYADGAQDIFVMSLFGEDYRGTFVDIGCREPKEHNNSLMLEEHGWTGVATDIVDLSLDWAKDRTTPFVCDNALTCDFKAMFEKYKLPHTMSKEAYRLFYESIVKDGLNVKEHLELDRDLIDTIVSVIHLR